MNDAIFKKMSEELRKALPEDRATNLLLPPPIFEALGAEIIDFDLEAQTMTNKYPVQAQFLNPMGFLQGGILTAIMDNTIGPLSLLLAPPSVTTQFNTSYLRPASAEDKFVIVTAECTERTRRQLFFTATVRNEAGKTLTIGHSTHQIVQPG